MAHTRQTRPGSGLDLSNFQYESLSSHLKLIPPRLTSRVCGTKKSKLEGNQAPSRSIGHACPDGTLPGDVPAQVDPDLLYGHHMAIGSAIGFLFLGGGRATLSTSNEVCLTQTKCLIDSEHC